MQGSIVLGQHPDQRALECPRRIAALTRHTVYSVERGLVLRRYIWRHDDQGEQRLIADLSAGGWEEYAIHTRHGAERFFDLRAHALIDALWRDAGLAVG